MTDREATFHSRRTAARLDLLRAILMLAGMPTPYDELGAVMLNARLEAERAD